MIKYALFDCDLVIVFRSEYIGQLLEREFSLPYEKTKPFFEEVLPLCYVGKLDLKEELAKYIGIWRLSSTSSELLEKWLAVENARIDERVLEVVDQFRDAGISCYIASNQEKYRAADVWTKIGKHFDGHFFSYEVGAIKTEDAYWQRLKIPFTESVFFDDNKDNILEAEKFGLTGSLFTDFDEFKKQVDSLGLSRS